MKILCGLVSALFVITQVILFGDVTAGSDSDKQALQAECERNLVAPCCWNMTVDLHDSPASREVRQKISELIEQGKTKAEILAYFTSQPQFGERILASPSQKTLLGKVAYWFAAVALILGAGIVALVLKRIVRPAAAKTRSAELSPTIATSKAEPSQWEKRVEDELGKFE
ncbi:MAG TPA: cytochrome c-type biogenesis protein CcmH [bacterium]